MCHTYVVLSEKSVTVQEMLSNPHESFRRWGLLHDLGGKSAEYVFGFIKLM